MAFSIDNLRMLGFPDEMIRVWKNAGIEFLLPLQELALTQPEFFTKQDQMVIAPTSAGKTLVAQISALYHLRELKKVVYLVPTKALAEEKYRTFLQLFKPFGFRIAIATRDRNENDAEILEGDYDLLIAVYEKLKSYLIFKPEMLNQIALIIADEIQILSDQTRGASVDILLTKILRCRNNLKTLFLSAVVGEPERFAEWLGIKPIIFNRRPIELREGVFIIETGKFIFQNFNLKTRSEEHLFFETHSPPEEMLEAYLELARYLSSACGEQIIVFLPMKYLTYQMTSALAEKTSFAPAAEAVSEIEGSEESALKRELVNSLNSGIGFHNSDLSQEQRRIVEQAFERGEIRVLFSTSTLAQGVNIGGRNVICSARRIAKDELTGRTTEMDLLRSEFKNQGGRAGRFGREADFGRAILMARDNDEAERIMREFVSKELEPVTCYYQENDFKDAFLDMLESGLIKNKNDWQKYIKSTYFHFSNPQIKKSNPDNYYENIFYEITAKMLSDNLLIQEDEIFRATGIGKITAAFGFNAGTTVLLNKIMQPLETTELSVIDYIFTAADSIDGREIHIPLRRGIDIPYNLVTNMKRQIDYENVEPAENLKKVISSSGGLTEIDLQSLKRTLIMLDWINGIPSSDIEQKWGVHLGFIQNMSQNFEWLLLGWSKLAESMAAKPEKTAAIFSLALRLRYGVTTDGLKLASMNLTGMNRSIVFALLKNGICDYQSLKETIYSGNLPEIIYHAAAQKVSECFKQKYKKAEKSKGEKHGENSEKKPDKEFVNNPENNPEKSAASSNNIAEAISGDGIILRIPPDNPGIVILNGTQIELKPKAYTLLCLLAESAGMICSYIKIDEIIWPNEKVERQQITQHKIKIIEEFEKIIGREAAENLIHTKTKHGLKLNLEKDKIIFD